MSIAPDSADLSQQPYRRTPRRFDHLALTGGISLAIVFLIAVLVVHPRGDFPILDDWDFAIAAWRFARTGHFHFTEFTAVSLRLQVLWGALWTLLFGESFHVLRASTLTLSLLSLLLVRSILLHLTSSRSLALVGALALLFHPLFFWSSFTFMTEVPFILLSLLGFYLTLRAIEGESILLMLSASIAVLGSVFIRQTGIINALPAVLLLAIHRGRATERWRPLLAGAAIPLLVFGIVAVVRFNWLTGSPGELAVHYAMWKDGSMRPSFLISLAYHYLSFNFQNAALFFLPFTLPLLWRIGRARAGSLLMLVAVSALMIWRAIELIASGHPMPYFAEPWCCDIFGGNIFVNLGLGPVTLSGTNGWGVTPGFMLAWTPRVLLTLGSAFLGAVIAWYACLAVGSALSKPPRQSVAVQLLVGHAALASATLLVSGLYVDRYSLDSLWALGILLPLFAEWSSPVVRAVVVSALVCVALFSMLATADYFAWNRARWRAVALADRMGIPREDLQGGAEVQNWRFRDQTRAERHKRIYGPSPPPKYVIAFQILPGYEGVAAFPFSGYLGLHRGTVLLERAVPRDGAIE